MKRTALIVEVTLKPGETEEEAGQWLQSMFDQYAKRRYGVVGSDDGSTYEAEPELVASLKEGR